MKKVVLTIIAASFSVVVMAQGIAIGVRAGLNYGTENISNQPYVFGLTSTSNNYRTGFLVGGYLTLSLPGKFAIQPELFYSATGTDITGKTIIGDFSGTAKTNYLALPVFLRFNATKNFHLLVGPQIGLLVGGEYKVPRVSIDIKQANLTDFSAVAGLGFDFWKLNVGARYSYGLSNVSKNFTDPYVKGQVTKNSVIQFVVGYRLFKIGK